MKRISTVKGTILRNRPVFSGTDERGNPVSGRVRFSRPLPDPRGRSTHFRIAIDLGHYRVARGYWMPGQPIELPVTKGGRP